MRNLKKILSILVMIAMLVTLVAQAEYVDSLDGATPEAQAADQVTAVEEEDGEAEPTDSPSTEPAPSPEDSEEPSATPETGEEPSESPSASATPEPEDEPTPAPNPPKYNLDLALVSPSEDTKVAYNGQKQEQTVEFKVSRVTYPKGLPEEGALEPEDFANLVLTCEGTDVGTYSVLTAYPGSASLRPLVELTETAEQDEATAALFATQQLNYVYYPSDTSVIPNLVIEKRDINVTVNGEVEKTYDGNNRFENIEDLDITYEIADDPWAETPDAIQVQVTFATVESANASDEAMPLNDVELNVTLNGVDANRNFNVVLDAEASSATAKINKKKLNAIAIAKPDGSTKEYDGTTGTSYTLISADLVAGDVISAKLESATKDVGENIEVSVVEDSFDILSNGVSVKDNYDFSEIDLTTLTDTITIEPLEVKLPDFTDRNELNKMYDGQFGFVMVRATTKEWTIPLAGGETATVTLELQGDKTEAGEQNDIVATKIETADESNYVFPDMPQTLAQQTIYAAPVIVAVSDTKVYDGTVGLSKPLGLDDIQEQRGLVQGHTLKAITFKLADDAVADVTMTNKIVVDTDTLSIEDAEGNPVATSNYEFRVNGYQTITTRVLTIEATAEKVYDGYDTITKDDLKTATFSGAPEGVTFTLDDITELTGTAESANASATAYKVPVSGVKLKDTNYSCTGIVTLTINKKPLTMTATGTKEYDGTADMSKVTIDPESIDQTLLAAGDIENDVVLSLTVADLGANPNAINVQPNHTPYDVPITDYELSAPGNKDNYAFDSTSVLKLDISPMVDAVIKIKGKQETFIYDGQTHEVNPKEFDVIYPDATVEWKYPKDSVKLVEGFDNQAKGTDVGYYEMKLTEDSFVNLDPNFNTTIKFKVEDGGLTIKQRKLTLKVDPVEGDTYAREYNGNVNLDFDAFKIKDVSEGENAGLLDGHTIKAEALELDGKDVGEHKINITSLKILDADGVEVTNNYAFELKGVGEARVLPKAITLTVTGSKNFGVVDPEVLTVEAMDKDGNDRYMGNGIIEAVDGEVITYNQSAWADANKTADHQLPDTYKIPFKEDDLKFDEKTGADPKNYDVTYVSENSKFTINSTAGFTIDFTDEAGTLEAAKISVDTHSAGPLYYKIVADDPENAPLIDNLADHMSVDVIVDTSDVTSDFAQDVPETLPMTPVDDAGLSGNADIPDVTYKYDETHSWVSKLPADTNLTISVTDKDGNEVAVSGSMLEVKAVKVDVAVETKSSLSDNTKVTLPKENKEDPDIFVVDPKGTLTITGDTECEDFWYIVTCDELDYEDLVLQNKVFPLTDLVALLTEGDEWYNVMPTKGVPLTIEVVDNNINHVGSTEILVAFDTGAESLTQTVENRYEGENLLLTAKDWFDPKSLKVEGTYGGAAVTNENIKVTDGDVMTWENINSWKNPLKTLPSTEESVVVTYTDLVGNPAKHTINVVKSQAKIPNTIYVMPKSDGIADGIVPNRELVFYGDTTGWEYSKLYIGNKVYDVPMVEGDPENYNPDRVDWSVTVNADDCGFEVGELTTVSIRYDNLVGGDATITLTYDDKVQEPVIGGGLVDGSPAFWGYMEASSSAVINIKHEDGTTTELQREFIGKYEKSGSVVVNFMGYFYVHVLDGLKAGDVVEMIVTDFCGNTETFRIPVQSDVPMQPFAEILGADIIGPESGRADDDKSPLTHRFATPIDLAEVASATEPLKLPILIDKAIELGTVTFTLEGNMLVMSYEITNPQFLKADAKMRMETYDAKPGIADVLTISDVNPKNVAEALTGSVNIADVTEYITAPTEEGGEPTISGTIWLSAQVDVQSPNVDTYISMIGADSYFYRWLDEEQQTQKIVGNKYEYLSSYEINKAYYKLYQGFQN